MAKETKGNATKVEKFDSERFISMVTTGEALGNELMEQLSVCGQSFEGLVIETYALSKAWSALLAIGHRANIEVKSLFESLIPMFLMEMEEILDDFEREEQ